MSDIIWNLEKRKISDLKEWENNPRVLTDKGIKDLTNSIQEFGCCEPIVINTDNMICGGHGRKKVLESLKVKEVDCYIPNRVLTHDEFSKLNLRLNKNIAGEFDFDLLANNFDFDLLHDVGFTDNELGIDTNEEIEEDILPSINTNESISKLGDIWELGQHRIMCGDSTDAIDIKNLLNNQPILLVVTDPPYGVNYDPEWREGCDLGVGKRSKGKVENDNIINWSATFSLIDPQILYVWHAARFAHEVAQGLIDADYKIICQIIWCKQHFALSRGDYHWQHEPCWYAVKNGEKHNWQGARDQSTIWEIKNNNSFGNHDHEETFGHGTQKPIECMLRPILNNSCKEEIICDPFLGSGTTLIACEQSKRICYGMEISPYYIDVIIKRYINYKIKNNQEQDVKLRLNGEEFDYKKFI